jgi:DNA polymerase-3 subunit epsilon
MSSIIEDPISVAEDASGCDAPPSKRARLLDEDDSGEFVVLDFETTGLNVQKDRVIEIGAAVIDAHGTVLRTYSTLCEPETLVADASDGECTLSDMISDLTGISREMLAGQPSTGVAIADLANFVGVRPILAHNAAFDGKFFLAECARAGLPTPGNEFVCTLKLARKHIKGTKKFGLGALRAHTGYLAPEGCLQAHRAMSDVDATVFLLRFMLEQTQLDLPDLIKS